MKDAYNTLFVKQTEMTMTTVKHSTVLEYSEFLGEHFISLFMINYDRGVAVVVSCKDGRKYRTEVDSFCGLSDCINECELLEKTIDQLLEEIEKDYCKSLPYVDRKVREVYRLRDNPLILLKD